LNTATGLIPAKGETAKVTPKAPDFIIEPKESICMKIDPSGSEVEFKLTPKTTGDLEVGAEIHLYDSADCSGPAIPKIVSNLAVTVTVNLEITDFLVSVWDEFKEFILTLIGILFAAIAAYFSGLLGLKKKAD